MNHFIYDPILEFLFNIRTCLRNGSPGPGFLLPWRILMPLVQVGARRQVGIMVVALELAPQFLVY